MTNGGPSRTTESRIDLLEWRAAVGDNERNEIRDEIKELREMVDRRMGRVLFAAWSLFAAIVGGIITTVIVAAVLPR